MNHLHLLNGDSISGALTEAGIEGHQVVWREVLSDGPAHPQVASPKFWYYRKNFMQQTYGVPKDKYEALTILEFGKVEELWDEIREITLWFEYDLFCQINLMALLTWLARQDLLGKVISLVCVGEVEGYDRLMALGELPSALFPSLFRGRFRLKDLDLAYAQSVWRAWCNPDPRALLDVTHRVPPAFPYLKHAIQIHRGRFPNLKQGLNFIEKTFLQWIEEGVADEREVVKRALTRNNIYGFGDLQYFAYLDQLQDLWQKGESQLELTDLGREVLAGNRHFLGQRAEFKMGGASIWEYRWNESRNRLEQVPSSDRPKKAKPQT